MEGHSECYWWWVTVRGIDGGSQCEMLIVGHCVRYWLWQWVTVRGTDGVSQWVLLMEGHSECYWWWVTVSVTDGGPHWEVLMVGWLFKFEVDSSFRHQNKTFVPQIGFNIVQSLPRFVTIPICNNITQRGRDQSFSKSIFAPRSDESDGKQTITLKYK